MNNKKQIMTDVIYHIRAKGLLDEKWTAWFDGFAISWIGQDETVLTGRVRDQAALHGILNKVRDLGLDLLLIKRIEEKDD